MKTNPYSSRATRVPPIMSNHAADRTVERTMLSPLQLLEAIRVQHAPRLRASKFDSTKTHLLVYDYIGKCFVVAIQEIITGVIVTVLTEELYLNRYVVNSDVTPF